jgi:hypothetical protein
MVAPASKRFSGSGSVTGSGNIMGDAAPTFTRSINISTVNLNDNNADGVFGSGIMTFNYFFPQYLTDYMPESTPVTVTVTGVWSPNEAMNGHTFTIMRTSQTLVDVDGSFSTFINTFNLSGAHVYNYYDMLWSWNS